MAMQNDRLPSLASKGRRSILRRLALPGLLRIAPLLASWSASSLASAKSLPAARSRVRPGQPGWPGAAEWRGLMRQVGGNLTALASPFADCQAQGASGACDVAFALFSNPFAVGDTPSLAQNLGWVDAWTFRPSAYAVAAKSAADVAAAVNFARQHRLRLVVKGGGHSYQGTSSAPDSLLIWTRHMNDVRLIDAFVPAGSPAATAAVPAVSVAAGAMWLNAYDTVTTKGGRYVQGGGCTTVGVAGHVQSGGFGSFSKGFGTAACNLLEAEVVTADGKIRTVNQNQDAELFWALKGGGGGSLGVVTRMILATHALPERFGAVNVTIAASSSEAFLALIDYTLGFAATQLCNPHWGEQIVLQSGRRLNVKMLFQGIDKRAAEAMWQPYFDWVASQSELSLPAAARIIDLPARVFWNASVLAKVPGAIVLDDRVGADPVNFVWAGDASQCGAVWHGYHSVWLPRDALDADASRHAMAVALVNASSLWEVGLHFNKGLAGASAKTLERVAQTATHPVVMNAFALAIIAAESRPAYPDVSGHEVDLDRARADAVQLERAAAQLASVVPERASYVAESNYFENDFKRAFWGANFARLAAAKEQYDPEGLFFVHNGVGSDEWDRDGFIRHSSVPP